LILDVRSTAAFASGHISGAVHLDLWGVSLIDTDPAPLNAFLWMIEHLLALRGVAADRPIVICDETSGIRAARVFWFLEFFGVPRVQVLDGGTRAWVDAGFPLTTGGEEPKGTQWTGTPVRTALATWQDVRDRLGSREAVLLDTRSDEEYQGTLRRARRAGAIPGAVHVEWTRNLTPDGRFKPAGELRAMYEAVGVSPDREVVAYCQGGYRAAHAYLALRLLGYPRVRNYLGSWKEWGDREDLPIERREAAGERRES
jgi:thiosulfate/3-mercaptopyruvate sulfurtransferase